VGEVRPARTADNSAVLIVPNVKVRMEAQHSIPPLIILDLLSKTCSLAFTEMRGTMTAQNGDNCTGYRKAEGRKTEEQWVSGD
jgi:hypothetical protein